MKFYALTVAAAMTAGMAGAAVAADDDAKAPASSHSHDAGSSKAPATSKSTDNSPQAVLSAIDNDNQLEIQAGQLAQQKGSSDAVKKFGQTLSDDHNAADQKVQALAKKKGIELSKEPADPEKARHAAEEKKEMTRLQALSGAEFDKAFMTSMAQGHQKTIDSLEKAKASTSDKDVQQLIDDLMPTLHKHESTATKGT